MERGIRTIAFPAISTGAYGFPMARAARIAVREVRRFLEDDAHLQEILLVCYGGDACRHLRQALEEATRGSARY